MRIFALCLLISIGLWIQNHALAEDSAVSAIKTTWENYWSANKARDAVKSAQLADHRTHQYYASLRQLALTGDEASVRKLRPIEKAVVLTMRMVGKEKLKEFSEKNLVAFVIATGFAGNAGTINMNDYDFIITHKTDAEAEARLSYKSTKQSTREHLRFSFEDGSWKFDVTSIAEHLYISSPGSGKTIDDVIIDLVKQRVGQPITPTIWQPLEKPS